MSAPVADLVILNARVWAGPDDEVSGPQTIVVRKGVIERIGDVEAPGKISTVCDVAGRVLTAGFNNCHVHFTEKDWARAWSAPAVDLQQSLDDMLLSRGFTTVLDLASDSRITGALKTRIEAGELRGPLIMSAGSGIRPWLGLPHYVRDSIPWYIRPLMPQPLTALGARMVPSRWRQGSVRHGRGLHDASGHGGRVRGHASERDVTKRHLEVAHD